MDRDKAPCTGLLMDSLLQCSFRLYCPSRVSFLPHKASGGGTFSCPLLGWELSHPSSHRTQKPWMQHPCSCGTYILVGRPGGAAGGCVWHRGGGGWKVTCRHTRSPVRLDTQPTLSSAQPNRARFTSPVVTAARATLPLTQLQAQKRCRDAATILPTHLPPLLQTKLGPYRRHWH